MYRSDLEGAWLVVVIRPDDTHPASTARHIDTYKVEAGKLPEDPAVVLAMVGDLRDLADDLEKHGWKMAFRNGGPDT